MSFPQWLFGGFRLDPDNVCLWRGTQAIALTPKAFAVLHYLVAYPDRLVTKDTLLDAVWPETAISDTVVRIAVGELRRALGDTVQASRFVATIHRRGYRFLAPVTVADPPEPTPGEEPLRRATPAPSHQGALPAGPAIPAPQEESTTWRCAMCQHPLHAPAPGPLSLRSRHPVQPGGAAGRGARGAVYSYPHVPHYGDVLVAAAGRGDAGSDRGEIAVAGVCRTSSHGP